MDGNTSGRTKSGEDPELPVKGARWPEAAAARGASAGRPSGRAAAPGAPCAADGEGDAGVAIGTVRKSGSGWEATDPAQSETAAMLARRVPSARTAYLGALYVLRQDDYPDRVVHAAHSLREVIDLLARSKQAEDERTAPLKHKRRKALLQAVFDPLALQEPRVDRACDELTDLYGKLSEVAHHGSAAAEDLHAALSKVEGALGALDAPQLAVNKEMDSMLSGPPSEELALRLTAMQHRWATGLRLAENLPVEWLPHMDKAGYFSEPQPAGASDRPSYAAWPASLYLRRCTRRFGAQVAKIILAAKFRHKSERNPAVYLDFLACACDLPLPDAERIADKAIGENWIDFADVIMGDKGYLDLASRLYLGGRHGIAAKMLFAALKAKMEEASREDEGRSDAPRHTVLAHTEWFAGELREKMLPMAKSWPWPVMELLGRFLDEIAKLDALKKSRVDKTGGGTCAVSALLDCNSYGNNVAWLVFQRRMVDFATSFTVERIREDIPRTPDRMARLRKVMETFYKKSHVAFRKIELSAYAEFPSEFGIEIETALLMYFGHQSTNDEHRALLEASFGYLSQQARLDVLRKVDEGPGRDFLDAVTECRGTANVQAAEKRWKLEYFRLVKDHLDGEHLATYLKLLRDLGEPKQPGTPRPAVELQDRVQAGSGPLAGKSADQAFEYMREHGNDVDKFFEKWHLGTEFEEYARNNPEECSKRAHKAKMLNSATLRYMVLGLDNALRDGRDIDWDGILHLIKHAAAATRPYGHESTELSLLIAMCGLIERGLKGELIDMGMRERVWGIIEALVRIGNEFTTEDAHARRQRLRGVAVVQARTGKRGAEPARMSPLDASLNGIDGLSFHAVCRYAAWLGGRGKKKVAFAPEARCVFNSYLDKEMGPHSAARHAVLGVFFPGFYRLDCEWAERLPSRIASGREAKAAFWEAYVAWNDVYPQVFHDLLPLYREFSKKGAMQSDAGMRSSEFTIRHVMLAHLYGLEGADEPTKNLLDGSDETLRECARQISIIMKDKADDSDFDKEKLAALWKDAGLARCDLGMWLVNSPLDKGDTIALYRDHVVAYPGEINLYIPVKHLAPYARDFPEVVAECLDALVGKCNGYVPDLVQDVLALLRGSGSAIAVERCRTIDERLAQRGHERGPE